jgi:uncharacterized protein
MWYEASRNMISATYKLPDDLISKLVKGYDLEERNVPVGLLRGVDQPIPSGSHGKRHLRPDRYAGRFRIYSCQGPGRAPGALAVEQYSYNWRTLWKAFGVPLHPGAARYCRERGYSLPIETSNSN